VAMAVLKGEGRVPIIYGWHASPASPSRSIYLARPNAVGRHPGVVVLHDGSGLGPSLRALCRRLARYGYVAAAPDLFRGETPGDLGSVDGRRAAADGVETVDALRGAWAGIAADTPPAVVGLGASAPVALEVAREARGPLVLLGGPVTGLEPALAEVRGPVLGLIAGRPEAAAAVVREVHAATGRGEWIVYRRAEARFFDDDADDFDPASYEDALERAIAFLDRHLAPVSA
jgi:dienelactone hydrolase